MIIDKILDRKDGKEYQPSAFYRDIAGYGDTGWDITQAMDDDNERNVKIALSKYILEGDYNVDIINYIYSVKWL